VLEALAQNVEITDDQASAARSFVAAAEGSVAQVVEQLHSTRERRGITRWVVREPALDTAEQVLAALR
jgi:hypothetical protein